MTECNIHEDFGDRGSTGLRCCATNRKVAGSIPDGVIGIFLSHNPSDLTMALGSTQPIIEMSIQSIYPHPTSCRSILIFSTHLRLGLPSGLLPSGFPSNTLYTPSPHLYAPHAQPISLFSITILTQYSLTCY